MGEQPEAISINKYIALLMTNSPGLGDSTAKQFRRRVALPIQLSAFSAGRENTHIHTLHTPAPACRLRLVRFPRRRLCC